MSAQAATFAAVSVALYAGHHVGDYWVQRDEDAKRKGDAGRRGVLHCLRHVSSYLATQVACLALLTLALGIDTNPLGIALGLLVSGITHFEADRREHGLMFKLARRLPGKAAFLELGKGSGTLGTGAWALDQAWHIFFGVFIASLIIAGLS